MLGPLRGACSRKKYYDHVRAARAFLCGAPVVVERLEREMMEASQALAFERAARLRDRLESFRWLQEHLKRIRLVRQSHSFVYPVSGHQANDIWYLIHRGNVEWTIAVPDDAVGRRRAARSIRAVYQTKRHDLSGPPSKRLTPSCWSQPGFVGTRRSAQDVCGPGNCFAELRVEN